MPSGVVLSMPSLTPSLLVSAASCQLPLQRTVPGNSGSPCAGSVPLQHTPETGYFLPWGPVQYQGSLLDP